MYSLINSNQPSVEPVSLAQLKLFLTLDTGFTQDDALLTALISAGRLEAENYTHRSFYNQQWVLGLDSFAIFWDNNTIKNVSDQCQPYDYYVRAITIPLPMPRCVSVDSIQYVDNTNTLQTLDPATYQVDLNSEPARVTPVYGLSWPSTLIYQPGTVKITFTAGTFGDGVVVNTIPSNIQTSIMLFVAHFYSNREGAVNLPDAFTRLLSFYRFLGYSYAN